MSAPYATEVEVVQAALHRVGESAIASLEDGSAAGQVASSNYEGIVSDYLCRHAWTFATTTVGLTYVDAVELGSWTQRYTFPATVLNIRKLTYKGGRDLESGEWDLQDGRILTRIEDADLQAVVTYRAAENKWPADFSEAIVIRMQAVFLEGLLDKWQDGRLKERDAESKLQRAITRDKRQKPADRVERVRLAMVWRGLRSGGY